MPKIIELYNDKLAGQYDWATWKGKWRASVEAGKTLREEKLIKRNLKILDLGIGTGQGIKLLQGKNCQIYGVDISRKMLTISKQKYPELKTIKYDINRSLKGMSFKSGYFDLIIAVGVLEFIKNIGRIIRETKRLLKSNGHFIFTYELLMPHYKFQNQKVQYNAEGYVEDPPKIQKFKLFRRTKREINKILEKTKYKTIRHFKFKAFLKGPAKIPVYYGLVLAKK